jgi:hypothetical protein
VGGCGLETGLDGLAEAARLKVWVKMRYLLRTLVDPNLGDIILLKRDLRPLSFIRGFLESDSKISASVIDNLGARASCILNHLALRSRVILRRHI